MGHRPGVTQDSDGSGDARAWPTSPHDAARFILQRLPGAYAVAGTPIDPERIARGDEPPVLVAPDLIEHTRFESRRVAEPREQIQSGFSAFLDGAQDIRIVNHSRGTPVVWGTVSAAVRARVNRRLVSWAGHAPIVVSRFYIPFRYAEGLRIDGGTGSGFVDTAPADASGKFPSRHPAALMEAAVKKVQWDRERCEVQLAEAWCDMEDGVLYVDGGLTASPVTSRSRNVIGVIKTHRRLYAEGSAFRVLVDLDAGCRTSVFNVAPPNRHPVASWYVRIRSAAGRDALFGLVRVEAANTPDIADRADEISRWLIAEGSPLALPDGRWDKMAYGVHDTEQFLRAIS